MLDYTYSKANFIFHRTVVSVKPILYLLLLRKKTCIGKTNFCGKKIFETERRRKEEGGRRTKDVKEPKFLKMRNYDNFKFN